MRYTIVIVFALKDDAGSWGSETYMHSITGDSIGG